MKKLFILLLIYLITFIPSEASDSLKKAQGKMHTDYSMDIDAIPFKSEFTILDDIMVATDIIIPANSKIEAEIVQSRRERRWHKSAYIIFKILKYSPDNNRTIDVSDKEYYLVARKYEPVDKKEAAILSVELAATTGASIFVPGVDILYFFTKGAITKKKHRNWFRSGVSNAYDNSLLWFILKGKMVDLDVNDEIKLKPIKVSKVKKLVPKIEKEKEKQAIKMEKVIQKKIAKARKKTEKAAYDDEFLIEED